MRIMIFGRPGSGKSHFAIKLHKATNISLYHLDKYFFVEKWIERNYQEFLSIQQVMVDKPGWIIDGNSIHSLELRYQQANICLYFNYSRIFCLYRVIKRLFVKQADIDDRAPGCPETLHWRLITYLWTFEKRIAQTINTLKRKYPEVTFIEIHNNDTLIEVWNYLCEITIKNESHNEEIK